MSPLEPSLPTATTVPPLRAVTPNSSPGLGLAMTLQLVPSQCSVTVPAAPPTAHLSLAEKAPIPSRKLLPRVFGFGLGTMLQLVPSQCSITPRAGPFLRLPGP